MLRYFRSHPDSTQSTPKKRHLVVLGHFFGDGINIHGAETAIVPLRAKPWCQFGVPKGSCVVRRFVLNYQLGTRNPGTPLLKGKISYRSWHSPEPFALPMHRYLAKAWWTDACYAESRLVLGNGADLVSCSDPSVNLTRVRNDVITCTLI